MISSFLSARPSFLSFTDGDPDSFLNQLDESTFARTVRLKRLIGEAGELGVGAQAGRGMELGVNFRRETASVWSCPAWVSPLDSVT